MRRLAIAAATLIAFLVAAIAFFTGRTELDPEPEPPAGWFEDRAADAGIDFKHFDPATPDHQIIETMGSGAGWIDFDADGWPDLLLIQQCPVPPAPPGNQTHRLYRNNRNGTFQDVTAAAGLDRAEFGQGCAVGDYDNDGFDDLLITFFGGIALLHNVPDPAAPGGRRFADATSDSGLRNPHWGTSCAWADLDGDGLLDLYVCNYVGHDPAQPMLCRDSNRNLPIACNPSSFPLVRHRLFRNLGGGKFEDASASSGLTAVSPAAGLAVAILDLDGDHRPDIYVANDLGPAYCLRNLGGLRFEDVALQSGTALGPAGARMSGMGVAAADFDGSGRPSLFVTNYQRQPNVLFINRGMMRFDESSFQSGLGGPSMDRLGFGTCEFDVDRDGRADLAVANGHVFRHSFEAVGAPYAQAAQLFLGIGGGKFQDASHLGGRDFVSPRVGRGLARSDYDNDGCDDLVMTSIGGRAALFHNRGGSGRSWIGLELVGDGKSSNRNAIGAEVLIEAEGVRCRHFVIGGGSYLSASDRRVTWGLGAASRANVTVRWPSGNQQVFRDVAGNKRWKLIEGQREAAAP